MATDVVDLQNLDALVLVGESNSPDQPTIQTWPMGMATDVVDLQNLQVFVLPLKVWV